MASKAPALPEARQCTDPDDTQFGSVAVNAAPDRWLVANPTNGGHWATDDEVKSWTTLKGDVTQ